MAGQTQPGRLAVSQGTLGDQALDLLAVCHNDAIAGDYDVRRHLAEGRTKLVRTAAELAVLRHIDLRRDLFVMMARWIEVDDLQVEFPKPFAVSDQCLLVLLGADQAALLNQLMGADAEKSIVVECGRHVAGAPLIAAALRGGYSADRLASLAVETARERDDPRFVQPHLAIPEATESLFKLLKPMAASQGGQTWPWAAHFFQRVGARRALQDAPTPVFSAP